MSTTISSSVRPCTLWPMLVSRGTANGWSQNHAFLLHKTQLHVSSLEWHQGTFGGTYSFDANLRIVKVNQDMGNCSTIVTSNMNNGTSSTIHKTIRYIITRAPMANMRTLWRPPVSDRLLDRLERFMWLVWPAMASQALMMYCWLSGAKEFDIQSVYLEGFLWVTGRVWVNTIDGDNIFISMLSSSDSTQKLRSHLVWNSSTQIDTV